MTGQRTSRDSERSAQAGRESAPSANNVVAFWTVCPVSVGITEYDIEHLDLFARLLDAETEGADEWEMARAIFGIAYPSRREWVLTVVQSHLARAHWLVGHGFPLLNW